MSTEENEMLVRRQFDELSMANSLKSGSTGTPWACSGRSVRYSPKA
jgi:hypothetical protein